MISNKDAESIFVDRRVVSLGLDIAGRTAAASPLVDLIDSVANPQNITSISGLDKQVGHSSLIYCRSHVDLIVGLRKLLV